MNRIHVVQLNIAWEDPGANFARAESLLRGRAISPGDLLALPEMFATGFSMNVAGIAEPTGGPTEQFLRALARRHGAHVVGGMPIRDAASGRGRNTALVVGPDGAVRNRYVKRHPFSFAGETEHYESGAEYVLFDWGTLTAAPLICYDLRFPESFRVCVRRGAELFVVIANWPAARREHWRTLLAARAIENQAYVVGVNRAGRDPSHEYAGDSLIIGPRGEVLADAGRDEGVVTATLDGAALRAYRAQFPALRDIADEFAGEDRR